MSEYSEKDVKNMLIGQLKKQSPEAIREWLYGDSSMADVITKHYKMIRMVLKLNPELKKNLEMLSYEMVRDNVCSVYPELRKDFEDSKVKMKIEAEIKAIKILLLGKGK